MPAGMRSCGTRRTHYAQRTPSFMSAGRASALEQQRRHRPHTAGAARFLNLSQSWVRSAAPLACALFTTLLKDRQQALFEEHVCQVDVSLVAFNRHLQLSNWGALNAGNCNRSDRWHRTRIRCSRVAFPPKAPSGETRAGSFWDITLSGMRRFAQIARRAPAPARCPLHGGSGRSLCVGSD
jgi:hypothetical protein